jgi:hypothetical protein
MDTVTNNTDTGDAQDYAPGFELRQHLRAVSNILHNVSHYPLSHSHRKKLRRLAALVDSAAPGLCVCVERASNPKTEARA